MTTVRQQNFLIRKEKILAMAETLLLDNHQDITLSEFTSEFDIAKGTIYKHFKSKNQLYLELIILNEQRLLEISKQYNHDIKTYVSQYMLYNMLNSNRTILPHVIEERLTNNERKLKEWFEELYAIREQRILEIKDLFADYLKSVKQHHVHPRLPVVYLDRDLWDSFSFASVLITIFPPVQIGVVS